MTRPLLTTILIPTLCLCLFACQPAPQANLTDANVAISSPPPGETPHLVLSGPPSWETPLRWQLHDSFVVVDGKPQPVRGHKTKRVIIPVTLTNTDGTVAKMNFLVDTGADRTVVNTSKVHADLKNAKVEQCAGVGGVQQVYVVSVPKLTVGALIQENAEVAFTAMPVDDDGLLGQDFLRHYTLTIDYRKGVFRLERGSSAEQK